MGQLISINIAKRQVALATDLDEVKDLRDRAETLRLYAKKACGGLKQQNHLRPDFIPPSPYSHNHNHTEFLTLLYHSCILLN
jgi:hypothetical protein